MLFDLTCISSKLRMTILYHFPGDVCFDKDSGFWLTHTQPRFPKNGSEYYQFPSSPKASGVNYPSKWFGQTFFCVTYSYEALNTIGKLKDTNNSCTT